MCIIYKYTSPEGKSYIGQTIYTPEIRAGVNGKNYKRSPFFYEAIQKYGFDTFKLEVVEECEREELNEREQYWIAYYNTLHPYGYNATTGGQGSTHTKKVYQFNQKGELIKEYESLTEAAKNNKCSVSSLSEVCSGRKITCLGYFWSYENIAPKPKKNYRNKRVYQFDEDGYLIKEFETIANAAHYNNVPYAKIYACASKNRIKRVNDMIFTYEPFIDWNYYTLKHKRSSTTIPEGSIPKREEALYSANADEDIVSTCEKS